MRIKLDENIPATLLTALHRSGHDVDSVPEEGLAGHPDAEVWQAAKEEGRFFITQDLDFSDLRSFSPGTHPGILLVRLRQPGREALVRHVLDFFAAEEASSLDGAFVVLTERKIRIRRPKPAT